MKHSAWTDVTCAQQVEHAHAGTTALAAEYRARIAKYESDLHYSRVQQRESHLRAMGLQQAAEDMCAQLADHKARLTAVIALCDSDMYCDSGSMFCHDVRAAAEGDTK